MENVTFASIAFVASCCLSLVFRKLIPVLALALVPVDRDNLYFPPSKHSAVDERVLKILDSKVLKDVCTKHAYNYCSLPSTSFSCSSCFLFLHDNISYLLPSVPLTYLRFVCHFEL